MEFEPEWDQFNLRLMETDAKVRLASLQLLLRRTASSATGPKRLAELGPRYYDPFTGLPMLWSDREGVAAGKVRGGLAGSIQGKRRT